MYCALRSHVAVCVIHRFPLNRGAVGLSCSFFYCKGTKIIPYMQAFKRLFYCIYISLTIAFKVVSLGVRSKMNLFSGVRLCQSSRSVTGADGRPKIGKTNHSQVVSSVSDIQ